MLAVENLVAGYRGRPAARLPGLEVAGGDCAVLLGPSGSGKTTLLLAMAGLAESLGGSVKVDGRELTALGGRAGDRLRARAIGLVFQDLHLVAGLTAMDNVLLAPFAAGVAQDAGRARGLLGELGLAAVADRRAETLSRGQAQRVAIARAMLLRPALILADEPTASLDDASCAQVARLLMRAARETSAALVIATHDARLRELVGRTVMVEPMGDAREAAA